MSVTADRQAWPMFPLAGFDVETTGRDPEVARIVQWAVGVADEPGKWVLAADLANPGVPIPAAASEIHRITDDQVAGAAAEIDAAEEIRDRLAGVWAAGGVVAGANLCYDLTVLDRALRRGDRPPLSVGACLDTYVLDKAVDRYRRGSRRLADTCAHYGIRTEGLTHDAAADCFAAVRLAYLLLTRYPSLRTMTVAELHDYQARAYTEQMLSLYAYFRRTGQPVGEANTEWPIRAWRGAA